jgi:YVTN family beta-propeller protein
MAIDVEGYDWITELARGGFGVVYRAHQIRFDRPVALKVLSQLDLDDRTLRRFERECRAMGAVSWHPHIVDVYESGATATGHPYLAMELLENGSLGDRMRSLGGPLPWAEAVAMAIQVAGALQCAHDRGLLHRDLKPENVLVGRYGEAQLTDFGIATVEGVQHTTTGMAAFTVSHAAPEILQGGRATVATDVYSLGSTLFHLLWGRPPFMGAADEDVFVTIERAISDPPPDLRPFGVPPTLVQAVESALAKDPKARPGSAAALGTTLQDVQRALGEPVTEMRLESQGRAEVVAEDTQPVTAPPPPPPSPAATVVPDSDDTVLVPPPPDPDDTMPVPPPPPPPEPPEVVAEAPPAPPSEPEPAARPTEPVPVVRAGSEPTGGGTATKRRRWLLPLAAAAALALMVVVAVVLLGGDGDPNDDLASAGEVVATIDVGTSPRGVAIGEGAVWVANRGDGTVSRVDPDTNEVTDTIEVGEGPREVAVDFGSVWVTTQEEGLLVRIDPATAEVVDSVDLGGQPHGVTAAEGLVWVTQREAGTVVGIDPDALTTEVLVAVEGAPESVAVADGTVWVVGVDGGLLSEVDIADQAVVATFEVGEDPADVAVDGTTIWIVSQGNAELIRLDTETRETEARVELGGDPEYLALDEDGTVWVDGDDEVLEVDPETNEAVGRIPVGDEPRGVAVDGDLLVVANFADATLSRATLTP